MPVNKARRWPLFVPLWVSNSLSVVAKEMAERVALPVDGIGDEQTIATGGPLKPDGSPVEGSMVQDAQREPVPDVVRASGGVPLDVCGVERHQVVLDPDVEVTDSATSLVRGQDGMTEVRVPVATQLLADLNVPVQPHRVADGLVERRCEVTVEDSLRGGLDETRVALQEPMYRLRQSPMHGQIGQLAVRRSGCAPALDSCQFLIRDLPELVGTEMPEGELRMVAPPLRAETPQQVAEAITDVQFVESQALLALLQASQRKE